MPEFDPTVQSRLNGPLTNVFQQRILAAKRQHKIGYWEIGRAAGVSDSYVGSMTRTKVNVRTATVRRVVAVIEKLETGDIIGASLVFQRPR